jgi:hypothetical protein
MTVMTGLDESSNNVYSLVIDELTRYGLESLAPTLVNLIKEYGPNMMETIKSKLRETDAYKQRFAGNEALRSAGLSVLSEAEYLYNERMYAEAFKAYDFGDLSTRENFAKLIGGNVSPALLSERIKLAYDKVQNADIALKNELNKMYPGISDSDLARSLLMGDQGTEYLKSRIGQAEILAEATTAGLSLQSSAEELQSRGVTREQAAAGLQKVSQVKAGMEQASRMFGENVSPNDLQKELESEALLGQTSKRTKSLASQARAQFGGQSGIQTGSLKRTTERTF